MYRISVDTSFCASHQIFGHAGKCKNLHGHNWKVKAVAGVRDLDAIGIGIDFKILKDHLKKITSGFDHRHLNEIRSFQEINPTSETVAKYIFDELALKLPADCKLDYVQVWETERYSATYSKDDPV